MTRRKSRKLVAPVVATADPTVEPTAEFAVANPLQAALQHAAARRAARPKEDHSPSSDTVPDPQATPAPKRQRSPGAKFEALFAQAEQGILPPAPDLSAPTHKSFRMRGEKIIAMAEAGDIGGLKADTLEPKSSTRVMICRFRDLAVVALAARARQST